MNNTNNNEFGTIRGLFFPIHTHELIRFIPMALIMLFTLFNYTVLRNLKDALVVTASGSGAEVIPYLKLMGTTPAAILFMVFYAKITNLFKTEKVFYLCLAPFLVFFGSFAAFIYPNMGLLHPSPELINSISTNFPQLNALTSIFGSWSFSLFYILAELWGSVMLSLLFWQFANSFIKKEEAKRFYPLFGFIAQIGPMIGGYAVSYFSSSSEGMNGTLNNLMSIVVINGILIAGLYWGMNRKIIDNLPKKASETETKKKKPKLSLTESFNYILTSPALLCIALIVFCYGVSMNFVDVLWKGQVNILTKGDPSAYANIMGNFSTTTAWITMALTLVGGNILRRFSWLQSASVVPAMLLVTGTAFFGIVTLGLFGDSSTASISILGTTWAATALAVNFGLWQNAFTKGSKYSLFDSTKEMAYIPLDDELKTKGKAAVDVVGGRSGKSGGSLIFVILSVILPGVSLPAKTPALGILFFIIIAVWFAALFKLNRELKILEGKPEKEEEVIPIAA